MYAASLADIQEAAERIKGVAHITPVLTSSTLDRMAGHKLFFKCEIFQKWCVPAGQVTCADVSWLLVGVCGDMRVSYLGVCRTEHASCCI